SIRSCERVAAYALIRLIRKRAMPLPLWLQILQAFALIAISAVGACLGWQQVRIARVKFQHDLFDRRFRVFEATRRMLAEVCRKVDASPEDQRTFIIETGDRLSI